MKVGILTFCAVHNYGAILQAYALQEAVNMLGHKGYIINLCPAKVRDQNRFACPCGPKRSVKVVARFLHAAEWNRQYERFEQFRNRFLNLTEHFENAIDLERKPPVFDAYIAGSDQVWNTEHGIEPVWLLNFVKEGKKIAYAPSFGTDSIKTCYHEVFQKYLPLFDALSGRERSGIEIIQQLTGLSAQHVLDPIFLPPEGMWEKISVESTIKGPYLLVYGDRSPEFIKLVPRVAARTGLQVVIINRGIVNYFGCANRVIRDAGPAEFLGLFRNAAMVCTDRFHGLAFSIRFKRDFFCVPHKMRNARSIDLLRLLGLEYRQLTRSEELDKWGDRDLHIDYKTVGTLLEREKEDSMDYLKRALI